MTLYTYHVIHEMYTKIEPHEDHQVCMYVQFLPNNSNMLSRSILSFLHRPVVFIGAGRWNIQYDPITTFRKVDWANEDHCGSCEIKTHESYHELHSDLELLGCLSEIPQSSHVS
jgi:hypothetical protein